QPRSDRRCRGAADSRQIAWMGTGALPTSVRARRCRESMVGAAVSGPGALVGIGLIGRVRWIGAVCLGRGNRGVGAAGGTPAGVGFGAHPLHHVWVMQFERGPLRTDAG